APSDYGGRGGGGRGGGGRALPRRAAAVGRLRGELPGCGACAWASGTTLALTGASVAISSAAVISIMGVSGRARARLIYSAALWRQGSARSTDANGRGPCVGA